MGRKPALLESNPWTRLVTRTMIRVRSFHDLRLSNEMTIQPCLLEAPLAARHYLEYRMRSGVELRALAEAVAAARAAPAAGAHSLLALGPRVLSAFGLDVGLEPFASVSGTDHQATSTQRDLFVMVQAENQGELFDQARGAHAALTQVGDLELEVSGFDYRNSHDLIGFEDGTANPKGEDAVAAAVIPDGHPGQGGSFLLTQKWVHDLPKFGALSVEEQERIVGRTKAESIELEGDAMPVDSHVSRTDVKVDGTAMKILRRSSPYGGVAEHGLYFVGFACEQRRLQIQIERMFGVAGDGLSDRLIDFSRAEASSYWFVPSIEDLDRLAEK